MDMMRFLEPHKQSILEDVRPKYITPALIKYKVLMKHEEDFILSGEIQEQSKKLFENLVTKDSSYMKYVIAALKRDGDGCLTYPWLAEKLENSVSSEVYNKLVHGNIPFPISNLLDRPLKLNDIRDKLLSSPRRCWIVLHGPIGSGKTVLAMETVRNNQIAHYFTHGIFWLHIGKFKESNSDLKEKIKQKMKWLLKLFDSLEDLDAYDRISELKHALCKETLNRPKCLLILDDVWERSIIDAFDIGCMVLVTTKNSSLFCDMYQQTTHLVKCDYDLEEHEVKSMLSMYVDMKPEDLPDVVNEIAKKHCKGSTIQTHLIGLKMAECKNGDKEKMWQGLDNRLDKGTTTLRRRYHSGDSHQLHDLIDSCLEDIANLKEYYLDFLIFARDSSIPQELLALFWGIEEFDVNSIMVKLCHRSLVQKVQNQNERSVCYSAPDFYLDTLKDKMCKEKKYEEWFLQRQRNLVQKLQTSNGLFPVTRGSYYISYNIGYHLYNAREVKLLEECYLNLKFVEQKIIRTEQFEHLLYEYDYYKECFTNTAEVDAFKLFIRKNGVAILNKADIIQLALFEPSNSIIHKKAYQTALESKGYYYECCNKDKIQHLFNYNIMRHASAGIDIKNATMCPDGSYIASIEKNYVVVSTFENPILRLDGHSDTINCCAFNKEGDELVTASDDQTVKIYKIADLLGKSENSIKRSQSISALETNGRREDNSAFTFTLHENAVVCCSFSPVDNAILSSDVHGISYLWTLCVTDGQAYEDLHHKFKHGYLNCPLTTSFSHDGQYVFISNNTVLSVWSTSDGQCISTLVHDSPIKQFCISHEDALFLSQNRVFQWNVGEPRANPVISKDGCFLNCCSLSPDGSYLACGVAPSAIFIYQVEDGAVVGNLLGHDGDIISVMFGESGERLFLLSVSASCYVVHDVTSIRRMRRILSVGNLSVKKLANGLSIATSNVLNSVEIRNGLEGNLVKTSNSDDNEITACSFSRDGSKIVYGTRAGTLKVFDLTSGSTNPLKNVHKQKINYILHSEKDDTFFSCSEDKKIIVWNISNDPVILKGHFDSVLMCMEFKLSRKLLSCSKDGSLRVWDLEIGKPIVPIEDGHGNAHIHFCDISPKEDLLASASSDGTIKVWDSSNGEKKFTLEDPTDENASVRCCRFLPNGRSLVSGHDNGKVKLWRFHGKRIPIIYSSSHDSVVYNILFAKDSHFLTLSRDIRLWTHHNGLVRTLHLPSSSTEAGLHPSCVWISDNLDVIVTVLNDILYILKRI